MQLTLRDVDILCFINDFGVCETKQLCQRFDLQPYRAQRIMKRLINQGLAVKEKIIYGRDSTFYLTGKGAEFTHLPKLNKISLGSYFHSIALIDLHLQLNRRYPSSVFISERQLRNTSQNQVGISGHFSDGILFFDNKKIAIELELSSKKHLRLDNILKGYSTNFSIDEVWYFCSKQVLPSLTKASEKFNYLKVYDFDLFLKGSQA